MFDIRNIRVASRRLYIRIKGFLLSTRSRESLVFLFFFFIAAFFWLLQTLNDTYETDIRLPIRLQEVPDNVIITSESADEVTIKVRDKGSTLLNYIIRRQFNPIELKFNDYARNNNRVRMYASDFRRDIMAQLAPSSELIEVNPDTLEFIYTTGRPKRVPVNVTEPHTTESQYYISDVYSSPDSVLVYAPPLLLRTIHEVRTESLSLTNFADTLRRNVGLRPIEGAKIIPDRVDLTLAVDIYTEKTVEIPVRGVRFPADKMLRTFPSQVQVSFQVGMSLFKQITAENFAIEIHYADLESLQSDRLTLKLTRQPDDVRNVHIIPEQVDFLIENISPNASH
ncbi:MAG: YbbR-like domain-containing protein [Prevotellaceae bacterium]|jgi:hypothetical protein|nr:YbbR-like domain-containing protein [Prevotellaceae bacterium]